MNKVHYLLFLLVVAMASGCGSAARSGSRTTDTGARAKVTEDLSVFRPRYANPADNKTTAAPITPTNHVNDKVAVLMDTVASVNKNIKYAQGFRIVAYTGSERQTVMNLRNAIVARIPEHKDYLTYQQPNFRLKLGDFFSRVEAQQVLNRISDLIPDALIVTDQINIK